MKNTNMNNFFQALLACMWLVCHSAVSEEIPIAEHNKMMDHGDGHLMDMEGAMVMGQNKDKLPAGCGKISEDVKIEVHAGRKYSKSYTGTIFGLDKHEWRVKPCTRLTVTFVNEDKIRHQWMMHGLPKYLYDKGMFHLEVTGPAKVAGTLILPAEDKTYLVHCDMAQHMEKGMKAQLIVGKGSGTFPSIPGITDPAILDNYGPTDSRNQNSTNSSIVNLPVTSGPTTQGGIESTVDKSPSFLSGTLLIGLLVGFIGAPFLFRRIEGMSLAELTENVIQITTSWIKTAIYFLGWLYNSLINKIISTVKK